MIDVEYNWLFSFNNDIPAGGKIYLIYAVNFYDHGDNAEADKTDKKIILDVK